MSTSEQRSKQIVYEMIHRLRQLQGSGEYVPVGTTIKAGEGLAGGGSLAGEVTISLSAQVLDALGRVPESGRLITQTELDAAVAMAGQNRSHVYYREFTLLDSPASQVESPPIMFDAPTTVTRMTVTVTKAATSSWTVSFGGRVLTVKPGNSATTAIMDVAFSKSQQATVKISGTDAAGIVVGLRCQEQ